MMNKRTVSAAVLMFVMMLVCHPVCTEAYVERAIVDPDRFASSGQINNNFSYSGLDIRPANIGCVFQGTITNNSSVLQAVDITVQAVDASDKPLWRHTISLPGISAGASYQFEDTIEDCPDTTPRRLEFEVSQ